MKIFKLVDNHLYIISDDNDSHWFYSNTCYYYREWDEETITKLSVVEVDLQEFKLWCMDKEFKLSERDNQSIKQFKEIKRFLKI